MSDCGWSPDTQNEVLQHRLTCIHEAGHAAVARHYGAAAEWVVYPNPTTAPHRQKLWGGLAYWDAPDWPKKIDRAIGLAGVISTALFEDPFIRDWQIMEALEYGDIPLSESDADGAAGYTLKDVRNCLFVVSRLMPEILLDASSRKLDESLIWVPSNVWGPPPLRDAGFE